MKSRLEIQEALKDEFGKTAIDDGIKIAEEVGNIERVPKEDLPKKESRKAYYRLPGMGNGGITDGENELPASYPYIGQKNRKILSGLIPSPSRLHRLTRHQDNGRV